MPWEQHGYAGVQMQCVESTRLLEIDPRRNPAPQPWRARLSARMKSSTRKAAVFDPRKTLHLHPGGRACRPG